MKQILPALLAAAAATSLVAEDFSAGSEARSWNLYAEVPATFEATVVDLLCEFTGDCPEDCGGGTRQLGLKRTADDVLVLAMKNAQPVFSGAAVDLAPFCNQVVQVDGLLIDDDEFPVDNIYLVQTIQPVGGEKTTANLFTRNWAQTYPEATGDGPWFRRDPRITAITDREGYLGLGLEADAAYAEENF